jgi:hypothetical protein
LFLLLGLPGLSRTHREKAAWPHIPKIINSRSAYSQPHAKVFPESVFPTIAAAGIFAWTVGFFDQAAIHQEAPGTLGIAGVECPRSQGHPP